MLLQDCIELWESKKRKMGCVAASNFLCKRVEGFVPLRLTRFTENGESFQHVVATNGRVIIDLAPYADKPK